MSDKKDSKPAVPEKQSNAGYAPLNEGYTPNEKGYTSDHEFGYVPTTASTTSEKLPAGPKAGTGVKPAPTQAKPDAGAATAKPADSAKPEK